MGLRKRPYNEDKKGTSNRKSQGPKSNDKPAFKKEFKSDKPFRKRESDGKRGFGGKDAPGRERKFDGEKPFGKKESFGKKRGFGGRDGEGKRDAVPGAKRVYSKGRPDNKPRQRQEDGENTFQRKTYNRFSEKRDNRPAPSYRKGRSYSGEEGFEKPTPAKRTGKTGRPYMVKGAKARDIKAKSEEMIEAAIPDIVRLNRYIANAGICSRREADDLISAGLVAVNGEIVTEMGYKVKPGDEIRYNNERLSWEKKVYLLMNKPKDTITSSDDPEGRRIIMDLIKDPRLPRVYPVGRLDRNTTGVILLTNDGELAQRLTHPKYNINKVYKAVLNKNFAPKDLQELGNNGVELEDGPIKPDAIGIPSISEKNVVLVQIHSGRNRIIHRMFEAMGYLVDKLDRLDFAGIERKGLERGEWRHLDDKEIRKLKKLVQLK